NFMPMKLNVGLSRKVGEPNYGSRGASVNLELELDNSLVEQPERLRDRIRQLYQLAKASVDEELNGNSQEPANGGGNGHSFDRYRTNGNGNGTNNGHSTNGHGPRQATSSQVKAIHAIAGRNRIDVARLVQDRFHVQRPDDLSITDASTLIDELKAVPAGPSR
ncbi:MAG: hypothetical protein HQ518_01990, partial [Rhodopirellula sp.]|nr:hypothetical protein [Rhodopirellula sp.]